MSDVIAVQTRTIQLHRKTFSWVRTFCCYGSLRRSYVRESACDRDMEVSSVDNDYKTTRAYKKSFVTFIIN